MIALVLYLYLLTLNSLRLRLIFLMIIILVLLLFIIIVALAMRGLPLLELSLVPPFVSHRHLAVLELFLLAHVRPRDTDPFHHLSGGPLRMPLL